MKSKLTILAVAAIFTSALTALAEPDIVGIGVALWNDNPAKTLHVGEVLPDSPASKAGFTKGLIITKINGVDPTGMKLEECVSMVRGPIGTTVRIEILDPAKNKPSEIELTRQALNLKQ